MARSSNAANGIHTNDQPERQSCRQPQPSSNTISTGVSPAGATNIGFAAGPYTFADNRHTVAMASELDELRKALDGMRASILRKVTGLSDADARRSTVPSGTNLAGLVQHLTYVESLWFEEIVSGRSARRGKRSMQVDKAISLATLRSEYRAACAASNAIISSIGDAEAPVTRSGKTHDLR